MIISLFLLLTSVWAIEGHFVYHGDQQTISTVRKETIYPGSTVGKERLAELRQEGYSCSPQLQFFQCTLGLEPEDLKNSYSPKVQEAIFGPVAFLNTQYEGESLVQYEAIQDVSINGRHYSKATYYEFKDFVKVSVGNTNHGDYFSFVVAKNSILSIEQTHKIESKWTYKTHWVQSTLQQK